MGLVVSTWTNPTVKPIETWFIGLLLFMIFLGPLSKVDVTIESVHTGNIYTVDDVPAIVGIAGFATSSLMYGLSRAFEDNWGNTDGFRAGQMLDPYRARLEFDKVGIETAFAKNAGLDPTKFEIARSLRNYMKECVMWDFEQGGSAAELNKTVILNGTINNLWENLKISTPTRTVFVAVGSPVAMVTCPQAWALLNNFFNCSAFM